MNSQFTCRGELPVRPHLRPVPRPLPCGPDEALFYDRPGDGPGWLDPEAFPLGVASGWPVEGEA
jgi:hypothetical protein